LHSIVDRLNQSAAMSLVDKWCPRFTLLERVDYEIDLLMSMLQVNANLFWPVCLCDAT
jgi:hypothetical protein